MKPTVAIIDPAVKRPAITAFNDMVLLSPVALTYHLPFVHGITSLLELEQELICGVVVLGSNMSVNDHSFQRDILVSWLRKNIANHCPVLGICYGHQLLAWMYGSQITHCFSTRERFFGLRKIDVLADEKLKIEAKQQELVVSHMESVREISAEFEVFASSEQVKYDGLRHRHHLIWTLQSHPEATQTFIYNNAMEFELPAEVKRNGYGLITKFLAFCKHNAEHSIK